MGTPQTQQPPSFDPTVITGRARYLMDGCAEEANVHDYSAERWDRRHYALGLPIVVLSALASTSAFSDIQYSDVAAGSIALVVAVLSALVTFLNPHKEAELHRAASANHRSLGFRARTIVDDFYLGTPHAPLVKRLRALEDEREKLIRESPSLSSRARDGAHARADERSEADSKRAQRLATSP